MADELDLHNEEKEEEFSPARAIMAPIHDPIDEDMLPIDEEDDGLHLVKPKIHHPHDEDEEDEASASEYFFNGFDNDSPYSLDDSE